MKIFLPSLFAFALLSQANAQSMSPGYWHVKENFKINGIPLPSNEDKECVSPAKAKDVKAAIVESLSKKGCSLTQWDVKGQDLQAGLKCKNKNFEAKGTMQGQFTKKSYTLQGKAKGKIRNTIPATAALELQGQWISTCPKPAGAT